MGTMKTHIEIKAQNLRHNLQAFFAFTGKKIMLTVKANAYGHGLAEVVNICKDLDFIDYYGVDSLAEALTACSLDRQKKILILGWLDTDELKEALKNGIEIAMPSLDYYKRVAGIARDLKVKARCHLKVETGTGRLGMVPAEVLELLNRPAGDPIEATGIYSHFANIEDTTDHTYARRQLEIFNGLLARIKGEKPLKHFSCSASTLIFPETYFDLVRLGISAYGFWPSKQTYISFTEKNHRRIELKPVLSWYSRVAQVKHIKQGEFIGYGLTYRAYSDARIIVIPVGYYDGYDRRLSNVANVIVNGVKAPVRGRICMDMFMAEVTHIPGVKEGDRVTLIGQEGEEKITVDYLAELCGTINYEFVSRLNPLIPRQIVH